MNVTKKVVLFIVEGSSDEAFFDPVINELYKNEAIKFKVVHGDITSDYEKTTHDNIETRINDLILAYMKEKKYLKSDIERVIHIIDTDGAFVSNANVMYHNDQTILYSDTKIRTKYVDEVIKRNELKKKVVQKLSILNTINGFPYKLYFMSCNLDHVLYNERNQNPYLKISKATDMADAFYGKEEEFVQLLESNVVTHYNDYTNSWSTIFNGNNSLRRASNLNLYFKEHSPSK